MSGMQKPGSIVQHCLGSSAAGTVLVLQSGATQILDANGRTPTAVSDGDLAALLANGYSIVSSS
jgi:hypothetical protein